MEKWINKATVFFGGIATLLTAVFGQYWFMFAGFFVCNVVDYVTGVIKAKYFNCNESSVIGAKGIIKKVMYWVVLGIAFFVSIFFVIMGEILGINLSFVMYFGWFTLATYLINEIRSILENLVEMDIKVPAFLIKGLEVADKTIDKVTKND